MDGQSPTSTLLTGLGWALAHAWLIPLLPLLGFAVLGLSGRILPARPGAWLATLNTMAAAGLAVTAALQYTSRWPPGAGEHPGFVVAAMEWLRYQPGLTVKAGALIDPLSLVLLVVATTVSALVHLYSTAYMAEDPGIKRFFTYLQLFTASMLGLVVAPNLVQTFVCWELVGVCSFLLIGFYYQTPAAVSASKKAFIVTRFADLGFLIGLLLLAWIGFQIMPGTGPLLAQEAAAAGLGAFEPVDFQFLNHPLAISAMTAQGQGLLGLALLCVFVGAAGKSAMFPLHIWLPDAMEGPTPVSALIHAATMVVAGVYLVARLFPAFAAAGEVLTLVMAVGALTALFAAVIGCTQDDIKRILAFSTLSQLGYMMFALGVASLAHPLGYTASIFHLFTHAFFKALLFLGAGAVIHAVHTNDIRQMGGLARKLPVTHATFLIATLAIAGVPPLAGFWSKDEILTAALHGGHPVVFGLGLGVAGLTAFYMTRVYALTFLGKARGPGVAHAHEASWAMLVPLVLLAILSVFAGFYPMSGLVRAGNGGGHHGLEMTVAIPSVGVGLAGIAFALWLYADGGGRAARVATRLGALYPVIKNKFYIDEAYLFVTRKVIFRHVARPIAWFDRTVVDGGVDASGTATRAAGDLVAKTQTGQIQHYAATFAIGAVVVAALIRFFGLWQGAGL